MNIYSQLLLERAHLKQDTPELRRTNLFMRLLLWGFTALCLAAITGLLGSFIHRENITMSLLCLAIAGGSYFAAETLVQRTGFYHHGIEEGLGIGAGILATIGIAIFIGQFHPHRSLSWSLPGSLLFFWLFRRFGWWYAAVIATLLFFSIPTSLEMGWLKTRGTLALMASALLLLTIFKEKQNAFQYERDRSTFFEGCLLLTVYLLLNLHFGMSWGLSKFFFYRAQWNEQAFKVFYWATYIFCWIIPLCALAYGIKTKKRVFVDIGLLTLVLSITTNKDYLHKAHFIWDPIPFGILLIGAATLVTHLLSNKARATRWGLSKESTPDPMPEGVELAALGVSALAQSMPGQPSPKLQDKGFGGGSSGGGGSERGF